MKKHYPGLVTRKIAVECQPFLETSNAKIKVKTSVATGTSGEEWKYKEEDLSTTITESSLPSLN